jgi:PAS domain S-box-containing protein
MIFRQIRKKLVFSFCTFITLLLVVIAAGTYAYFRHSTRQLIFNQQSSMIGRLAHDLDHHLTQAHSILINISNSAGPLNTGNGEAAYKWLQNRPGALSYFSLGLIVLDKQGTLVASNPAMPDKIGTSFARRDFFITSMSTGKPFISGSLVPLVNDHPAIMMTVPLRADDGSIQGLLCGAIDILDTKGLIGSLRDIRIGSTGYLYMYAPDRTMIMHPDASRIMKKDVMPGMNKLFDRALEGFEGSGETVNSRGLQFLASFKRLQSTGWILVANYPISEAYQPITRFRNYYLLGMFLVLLAAITLAWKLGVGISGPLSNFTLRIKELSRLGSDKKQRLDEGRADELGLLAVSFNTLLDEVQRREQDLQQSEELLHLITSSAQDAIIMLDEAGKIVFWNEAAIRMFGYFREEIVGCKLHELLPPIPYREAHNRAFPHFQKTGQGAEVGKTVELAGLRKDGSEFPLELSLSAVQVNNSWHSIGVVRDVSGRKQAEEALRCGEEKLRTVADHIYEWEIWRGADGGFVYISPSCKRITGYTAEEFLADPGLLTVIVHPEDQEIYRQHIETIAADSAPDDCQTPDYRILTRTGDVCWISHVCQPVYDAEGRSLGRRICNRDITKRKLVEEELLKKQQLLKELNSELEKRTHGLENANFELDTLNQELENRRNEAVEALEALQESQNALSSSEDRLRTLFEMASDALFIHDYAGNLREVNKTACERLGYTRDELLALSMSRLETQDSAEKHQLFFGQLRQNKKVVFETEHICKDGTRVTVEVLSKEIELGGELLVFSTARDTTERSMFQEKLLKLSMAVENSPASVVITDYQGIIEYVNPKFSEVTGYLPEEAIGRNPRILKADFQPTGLYTRMWETLSAGQEWYGEFCNKKKNGDIFWEHASISPIKNDLGHITHFVAIKEDITEQKHISEELVAARDAANAANSSKSQFLANMSHEIRTPLNAIIGFSGLALKKELPLRQQVYVQKIHTAGEQLLTIINDILDFSKIEAGQLKMEQIPFKLETMIADSCSMVQQRAHDKGLSLQIKTSADVSPWLVGDPHRLRQVIVNLLSNAVKFTERGEVALAVRLLTRENDRQQLEFSISDTGIGIPWEKVDKLFQPFTQADGSTTRRFGGTGLGLSISKQLVELMGGVIRCESTPDKGSVFSFTSSLGVVQEGEIDQYALGESMERDDGEVHSTFPEAHILLVEDNEINRQLVVEFLKETGVVVDIAVNGKEAVEMVTRGSAAYDLILMDIQMPVMDGYEAARLIRQDSRFAGLPIVAMTAHAMHEAQQKILQGGMDGHITKPINARNMLDTISFFLKSRHSYKKHDVGCRPEEGGGVVIPAVTGLDIPEALRRLDGNRTMYLRILRSFADNKPKIMMALEEAFREGNTKRMQRYAHTIKGGLAGSMGATELEDRARSLENALAQDNSPERIKPVIERLGAEMDRLATELEKKLTPVSEYGAPPRYTPPDTAVIAPILDRLLFYINSFDGKAERYLDDYQTELSGLPIKELAQIRSSLQTFDFAAAHGALLSLAAQYNIALTSEDTEVYTL